MYSTCIVCVMYLSVYALCVTRAAVESVGGRHSSAANAGARGTRLLLPAAAAAIHDWLTDGRDVRPDAADVLSRWDGLCACMCMLVCKFQVFHVFYLYRLCDVPLGICSMCDACGSRECWGTAFFSS